MASVIGRAETSGGPGSIEAADLIEPARAVRRALADAGRKAVEVDRLVIAAVVAPTAQACRDFARRALGPHGSEVAIRALAVASDAADVLAEAAAQALQRRSVDSWGLAVCVGFGSDGRTVALCLAGASGQRGPGDEADDRSPELGGTGPSRPLSSTEPGPTTPGPTAP